MVLHIAAYHKGANRLLKSKTKDEIALLLRYNGISQIAVSNVDGTEMNYLVPAPNDRWMNNNPSADDLKAAARKVLRVVDPNFDRPPYQFLFDSKYREWGPADSKGWRIIFSAPYVSTQVAVELKWTYGKNYVANPISCSPKRSVAMVTDLLRQRWYSQECNPSKRIDMARSFISEYIREDQADNPNECHFTNDDLNNLQGFTDEDVARWKVECCMDMDGLDDATDDEAFDDEESDEEE